MAPAPDGGRSQNLAIFEFSYSTSICSVPRTMRFKRLSPMCLAVCKKRVATLRAHQVLYLRLSMLRGLSASCSCLGWALTPRRNNLKLQRMPKISTRAA